MASKSRMICVAALAAFVAGPGLSQSAEGMWQTQADGKGQTALVAAQPCGDALCGTITQVMDANGNKIEHRNVGRRIFWDMRQVEPGVYEGRAFVPAFGAEYAGRMTIDGNNMKVGGCLGPICKSQTWTRAN